MGMPVYPRAGMLLPIVSWFLALVHVIAVTGCAGTRTPARGESIQDIHNRSSSAIRGELVRYAWSTLGTHYAWGGTDPSGFDCSGLVHYVYGKSGFQVPRTADEQLSLSAPLDEQQLKPGDLVFFDTGFWQTHVGIYLGNGKFIHASGSDEVVKVSSLHDVYWRQTLIQGGDFLQK